MKKNKLMKLAGIVVMMILCLIGCANEEAEPEIEYADQDFLEAMADGLEARWTIVEPEEGYVAGDDVHKEHFTKSVNAELDILREFSNKTYEDSKLQEKAISYINCLKQQEEALTYMQVDYEKYYEMWQEAYDQRTKLIIDLYDNYGLPISEEHIDTVNDIKTNAQLVEEKEQTEKQVQEIMAGIEFKKNSDESSDSYFTYDAVVENTSDTNFEYFDLDISLYDEEGIVVDTPYCNVGTWKSGQKIKFSFSTSEKFDKYEINSAEWYEGQ